MVTAFRLSVLFICTVLLFRYHIGTFHLLIFLFHTYVPEWYRNSTYFLYFRSTDAVHFPHLYLKNTALVLRTHLHKHMRTSFRQILPQTALKILAGRKPACGFLPTLQQNYARKSAHISYEDRFSIVVRWRSKTFWDYQYSQYSLRWRGK